MKILSDEYNRVLYNDEKIKLYHEEDIKGKIKDVKEEIRHSLKLDAVVGFIDKDEVIEIIDKHFGKDLIQPLEKVEQKEKKK